MKLVVDAKDSETGRILAEWIEKLRNGQVKCLDISKNIPEVDYGRIGSVVLCDGWHENGEHLTEVVHDVWREWEPEADLTLEQLRKLGQASRKWFEEVEE